MANASTLGSVTATSRATTRESRPAGRSFLSNIRVDHGPSDVLAHFFIAADAAFEAQGIDLEFASFEELEQANVNNQDSWKPLNPTFVPANGLVDDDSAFTLIGYDNTGNVMSAVACKRFDWLSGDFKTKAESMEFLYADPDRMAPPGAGCIISAQSAGEISGRAGYGGAAWIHPSKRKRQLASAQARLVRAIAFARWQTDVVFGISSLGLIGKGYSNRNGWKHIEAGVSFANLDSCPREAGLVWMTAEEILEDTASFLSELRAGGRNRDELRRAENSALSGDIEGQNEPRVAHRRSPT